MRGFFRYDRKRSEAERFSAVRVNQVRRLTIALFVGVLCLSLSSDVHARLLREGLAQGPALSLLVGPNFCLNSGNAQCADARYGLGADVGFHFRFLSFISLGLGFDFGFIFSDEYSIDEYRNYQFGITMGPTFHIPFRRFDLSFSIGLGWGRQDIEISDPLLSDTEVVESENNSVLLGLGTSFDYRYQERYLFGFYAKYMLPLSGETCGTLVGGCNGERIASNIVLGFRVMAHLIPPKEIPPAWPEDEAEEQEDGEIAENEDSEESETEDTETDQTEDAEDAPAEQVQAEETEPVPTEQNQVTENVSEQPSEQRSPCICMGGSSGYRTQLPDGTPICRCERNSGFDPYRHRSESAEQQNRPSNAAESQPQQPPIIPANRVCDPGATQSCLCIGGGNGVQICEDTAIRWGRCHCSPPIGQSGSTQ